MAKDLRLRPSQWFDSTPTSSLADIRGATARAPPTRCQRASAQFFRIMTCLSFLVMGLACPRVSIKLFSFSFLLGDCSKACPPVAPKAYDHFLFENGARVIDELTSASLQVRANGLFKDSIAPYHQINVAVDASSGPPSIPEAALGIFVDPRVLWYFSGSRGLLGVAPARTLRIDRVAIKSMAVTAVEHCVPDQITLWGLTDIPTGNSHIASQFPRRDVPAVMKNVPSFRGLREVGWVALAEYSGTAADRLDSVPADANSATQDMKLLHQSHQQGRQSQVFCHAFVLEVENRYGNSNVTCFAGVSAYGMGK